MDTIEVEVLEDGTLKVTTDQISTANHRNADEFLKLVKSLVGGEVETTKRTRGHTHNRATQDAKAGG